MRTGRSLAELAVELERQQASKKDYIAPKGSLDVKVVEGEIVADGLNGNTYGITPHAHGQFATELQIPKAYYDRMLTQQPALLADNMNTWLHADADNKRMIRTLDGKVRALLSPKFRPLDNFQLAEVVIPALLQHKAQVVSAELTETKFYIKAILPDLSSPLPDGMTWGVGHNAVAAVGGLGGRHVYGREGKLVSAITVQNSDVGAGTLRIEPSVFTSWCTNLAILSQAAMKKYHVGRSNSADDSFEVFRDATRVQDEKAFWMKVHDVTMAAFDRAQFDAAVAQIAEAAGKPIVSKELPKVVEVAIERLSLPAKSGGSILTFLAKGGDLSKWGLSSAITEAAGNMDDISYEEATAMERAGGEVITLTDKDWAVISEAA